MSARKDRFLDKWVPQTKDEKIRLEVKFDDIYGFSMNSPKATLDQKEFARKELALEIWLKMYESSLRESTTVNETLGELLQEVQYKFIKDSLFRACRKSSVQIMVIEEDEKESITFMYKSSTIPNAKGRIDLVGLTPKNHSEVYFVKFLEDSADNHTVINQQANTIQDFSKVIAGFFFID